MALFSRGHADQAERVAVLERELARVASEVRLLQTEQATIHDQVRRWMRRAVAAERRANQETVLDGAAPSAPSTPPVVLRSSEWGARGRIARRRALQQQRETVPQENGRRTED